MTCDLSGSTLPFFQMKIPNMDHMLMLPELAEVCMSYYTAFTMNTVRSCDHLIIRLELFVLSIIKVLITSLFGQH